MSKFEKMASARWPPPGRADQAVKALAFLLVRSGRNDLHCAGNNQPFEQTCGVVVSYRSLECHYYVEMRSEIVSLCRKCIVEKVAFDPITAS